MEPDVFFTLHSITKKMRNLADTQLAKYGITNTEMRLLNVIYFYGVDGASQDEFIKRIEIDRSNVGRSLKKLENMGYIRREKSATDQRSFNVFLTERGANIKDDLMIIRDNIKKLFSLNIKVLDFRRFEKILKTVDTNLNLENYEKVKNED